jgi:hypothetical protein
VTSKAHAQRVAPGILTITSVSVSALESPMLSFDLVGGQSWMEVSTRTPGSLRIWSVDVVTGRWTPERKSHLTPFNEHARVGEPFAITVYFSPFDWQGLAIPVAKHADGSFRVLTGCAAFETEILKWAESGLGKASSGNFQSYIEAFLYLYSQRDCVEKVSSVATLLFDRVTRLLADCETHRSPLSTVSSE